MLQHVGLVVPAAFALRIVDVERAITEEARERDATLGCEIELVAGDCLPGELATDVEPADVTTNNNLVPRSERHPKSRSDKGIGPIHRP